MNSKFKNIDFSSIKRAKYIKLGEGGKWDQLCFSDGTVRLGYYEVPEEYKMDQGTRLLFDIYRQLSKNNQAATSHARQVYDFYDSGSETLWITFSAGRMWWCYADKNVEFIGHDEKLFPNGSRLKRSLDGWHDCSIGGKVLYESSISGRLTKIAGFRGTICDVKLYEFEYLLRILQDQKSPKVERAENNINALQSSIEEMLKDLTWEDFEVLIGMIFSAAGWRRVSPIGGFQKTVDIEFIMPITGERAIVQVKSSTDKKQFEKYVEKLCQHKANKIFYVYHTASSELSCDNNKDVKLMGPKEIASNVLRAGLVDWMIGKAG